MIDCQLKLDDGLSTLCHSIKRRSFLTFFQAHRIFAGQSEDNLKIMSIKLNRLTFSSFVAFSQPAIAGKSNNYAINIIASFSCSPKLMQTFAQFFSLSTDERDAIQKKTFTKWVNKHLKKVIHDSLYFYSLSCMCFVCRAV